MNKQILCEKPIATEVEDATAMIITCEKNGVIFYKWPIQSRLSKT
ncbi:Gfo/Idh/MocA family oxidoreductase [Pseudalkalibacillus sp. A8]